MKNVKFSFYLAYLYHHLSSTPGRLCQDLFPRLNRLGSLVTKFNDRVELRT